MQSGPQRGCSAPDQRSDAAEPPLLCCWHDHARGAVLCCCCAPASKSSQLTTTAGAIMSGRGKGKSGGKSEKPKVHACTRVSKPPCCACLQQACTHVCACRHATCHTRRLCMPVRHTRGHFLRCRSLEAPRPALLFLSAELGGICARAGAQCMTHCACVCLCVCCAVQCDACMRAAGLLARLAAAAVLHALDPGTCRVPACDVAAACSATLDA